MASYLQYTADDRVVAALPMFHVFCLTVAVNAPIVNGATILMLPKFSPKEVFRICRTYEPTIFAGVPTMYNYLYLFEEASAEDVKTLRLCISGGASMPVALLQNFEKNVLTLSFQKDTVYQKHHQLLVLIRLIVRVNQDRSVQIFGM